MVVTQHLVDQYEAEGTATVPLVGYPDGPTEIARARSRLRGAATRISAKVVTYAAEEQPGQGATTVIGEIVHGSVDGQKPCWICCRTAERLARTGWLYKVDGGGCTGTLERIVNDDPQDFRTELVGRYLADAGRAAWLALKRETHHEVQ